MRVGLVNPFDNLPSEKARLQRYSLLADAFSADGCETVWWSSDFSHAHKRRRPPEAAIAPGRDWRLVLVPTPPYRSNVSLARFRSHRMFAARFAEMARNAVASGEIAGPDLIVASSPPLSSATAAIALARDFGCKAVIDIQDAWPETFARLVPLPGRLLRTAASHIFFSPLYRNARAIYRAADGISAVSRRYISLARSAGAHCPTLESRLAIDCGPRPGRPAADGTPAASVLKLAYAGNMGRTYDLETAIRGVAGTMGVTLDLAGAGPCETRLREIAAGCPRVVFHGYLDGLALRSMLERCDIGLVPMSPDAWVGVPGKFADYAAAGLAIASTLPGEAEELLDKYGAGFKYVFGSEKSFAAMLESAAASGEGLAVMGANARRMAEEIFSAARICREFVAFARSVAGRQ